MRRLAVVLLLWAGATAWAAEETALVAERRASLAQALAKAGPLDLALARLGLAIGLNVSGEAATHDEAARLAEQALAAFDKAGRGRSAAAAQAAQHLALARHRAGHHREARAPAVRAARLYQEGQGLKDEDTVAALDLLGDILAALHEDSEAIRVRLLLVDGRIALEGHRSPRTRADAYVVATALWGQARNREALALIARLLADDPPPDGAGDAFETWSNLVYLRAHVLRTVQRTSEARAEALRVYELRSRAWGADDARSLQAQALVAEGLRDDGEPREALALLQQIHARTRAKQGDDDLATVLAAANVARTLQQLDRVDEALVLRADLARRAAARYGDDDDLVLSLRMDEAQSMIALGRYGAAVEQLQAIVATTLKRHGPAHPMSIEVTSSWMATCLQLGRHDLALQAAQLVQTQTARLFGAAHRRAVAAVIDLALVEAKAGRSAQALARLQPLARALERRAHPAHDLLYKVYTVQAEALTRQGQRAPARTLLQRALALAESDAGEDGSDVVDILIDIAALQADPRERLATYTRVLRSASAARLPEFLWRAHAGLMATHADLQQPALATLHGKQAINVIQGLRGQMTQIAESAQQSFLNDKRAVYERTAQLLLADGRLPEAQQVLGLLKQQEYSDYTHRGGPVDAASQALALNAAESQWQQRLNSAGEHLVAQARAKAALDAKLRSAELSADEQARHRELSAALKAARESFDATLREIAAASAAQPQRLGSEVIDSVRAMRSDLRQLGHGAVLLHYLLGADRLWILLTTPEVQIAREVKVPSVELHQRIDALRTALRSPRGEVRAPAQALHRLLLAPVVADLAAAQAQTVMLSLDGALRYVPFAVLHDGQGYAVERYRFALFTEAARSKIKDRPAADWSLSGFGLTKAVGGFAALPAVRDEFAGLAEVMPGEAVLDEAFTAARMKALLTDPKPVLHIASHFKFTPGTEADSYLLMGDGGRLTLQQIRQEDLQFDVDLLTLSACETAVGDNARGTEVEGLGALAQKQGAKAVLATLWPVADASTGLFMREMYRRRSAGRLTKAEAIAQVQRDFIAGRLAGGGVSTERGARVQGAAPAADPAAGSYAHPFYWAPFILMGNWL